MNRLAVVILSCVLATPMHAQRADSAAVARAALGEAARRLATGDTIGAARHALHATTAWPMQGGYLLPAARVNALAGNTAEALALLRAATAMGFAWNGAHPAFASLTELAEFDSLRAGGESNARPVIRSEVLRVLVDSTLHPEGVAHDPATGRWFVSSVRHAKVVVIAPDDQVHDFASRNARLEATFGLVVDTARGRLWIATSRTPEAATVTDPRGSGAAIVGVDLDTGELRERWIVADTTAPHLLGDVVLAPDGALWAIDSRTPALYRMVPDGRGGVLAPHPLRTPDWVSLQGMAFDPRGEVAWLADWTTGLYRLDLRTNVVTPVDGNADEFTLGIDGLYALPGGDLVAIQNGITPARVVRLALDETGASVRSLTVLDRHIPIAEEPTLGVVVGQALVYVANSPWSYYEEGRPTPGAAFPRPVLLRLPIVP
ncbi:MAG TPA: hypothetical protein VFN22_05605 [Gemmatimonadales bacterium]|nr:hypothetical protein [Gemmatimonadales bacterium]